MRFAAREAFVFAIWIMLALPSGIVYALYLRDVLGRDLAWVGGATVVMVPVIVLVGAVALWLPVFLIARARRRARLGWQAPLVAAALVSVAALVFGGPNSFAFASGATPLLAWWVVGLAAAGAFLHDRWSRAWLGPEAPTQ